jgi:putative addiction module component (TIGR02574 family)
MTTPLQAIEAEAMKLSAQERADLADRLWISAHDSQAVDAAWQAEIERRVRQIDSGEVVCRPWAEVMAGLKVVAQG